MPYIFVRHKVRDYAAWKPAFDRHGVTRKAGGGKGSRVFRSADNPNEVLILMEWDTIANAKKFAQSADLKTVMQAAGVVEEPTIFFLDQADQQPQ